MATEFKLNYSGSEINRKLADVDVIKADLENSYYTSTEIDVKFTENDGKFDEINENINTKIGEVNSSIDTKINEVNASLAFKADLVDGKIPVEQIPDGIGGLTEVAWEDIQNKPFYVTGYKVEWNGKPTEEYVDDLFDIAGIMLYKVGEPITKEALVGSTATAYMDGNDVSFAIPQEFIIDMTETGFLIMDPSSGAAFGGVTFGADAFDLSPLDIPVVLEMPSAGLWFLSDGNNNYIKSITSPDYDCKQLDPRVIPANLDFDLSDYYTKEETNELINYIEGLKGDIDTILNEISETIGE